MIQMVQELIKKEIAYIGQDKSVYFAIKKFPHYGRLSHLKLDELEQGASERVQRDEYTKESASDFVLWKSYDQERDGDIYWESPFGRGRPGWHLECSVMAKSILGETIDLHAGGVDLIFPHHENEIAQSEGCNGKCFSKMWVHAEHLLVDNRKMSKSLGNFYTLRDLVQKGYTGTQIRYLLLSSHFRMPLNFTFQGLDAAKSALQRINDFISRLESIEVEGVLHDDVKGISLQHLDGCLKALANDINTSSALSHLFELIREVNIVIDKGSFSKRDAEQIIEVLKIMDSVFGVMSFQPAKIPEEIVQLAEARVEARKAKNWTLSDKLRDQISEKGYIVEDIAKGFRLKLK